MVLLWLIPVLIVALLVAYLIDRRWSWSALWAGGIVLVLGIVIQVLVSAGAGS